MLDKKIADLTFIVSDSVNYTKFIGYNSGIALR